MGAHVVIGANYGDEGKGLMVDYLTRRHEAGLVVRFNGGAQAGHTVVDGDVRHVFSHFSAGTFAGAATYLSRFFVCNPLLFANEMSRLGFTSPKVIIDPRAQVTTPWDMLINQAIEEQRGDGRHGSCGVGFNETLVRADTYPLTFAQLQGSPDEVGKQLADMVLNYFPRRCLALGLSQEAAERCTNLGWIEHFALAAAMMANRCKAARPSELKFGHVIFEGAQGLLLDQGNRDDFPHLTRSNTGCVNAISVAREMGIDSLELVYVTRSYLTRHGAGPLPNEWKPEEVPCTIVDKTNVPHPFQGSLRFAPLDVGSLVDRINRDASICQRAGMLASRDIAVTCVDQVPAPYHNRYCSFGPSANFVADTLNQRASVLA